MFRDAEENECLGTVTGWSMDVRGWFVIGQQESSRRRTHNPAQEGSAGGPRPVGDAQKPTGHVCTGPKAAPSTFGTLGEGSRVLPR